MALRVRIISLETEYGLQFFAATKTRSPHQQQLVKWLQKQLAAWGFPGINFLRNGSKFEHDVGHAEWSLPECLSARQAATYDKAADHLLAGAVSGAQRALQQDGHEGSLFLYKNNVDPTGQTSWGCHENYQMLRSHEQLGEEPFLRYQVRCLVPFLVTRQLYCGAGKLVSPRNPSAAPTFALSQRADFIEHVIARDTRYGRGIFHRGRENEPLAEAKLFRRLHLILGDSNCSAWSTWMKLGTTALVVRMIEDLFLAEIPILADPVNALRELSRDLTCRSPVRLHDGVDSTAVRIQRWYCEQAEQYLEAFDYSEEEAELLVAWAKALDDLEAEPLRLRNRADWAIKKAQLDYYLQQQGCTWDHQPFDPELTRKLLGLDLHYHDVGQQEPLARLLEPEYLVPAAAIQQAQREPPPLTRASVRSRWADQAVRNGWKLTSANWMAIRTDQQKWSLEDPLAFSQPDLARPAELLGALACPLRDVRLRAVAYLALSRDQAIFDALARVAKQDGDEQVRRAALDALGQMDNEGILEVALDCLNDPSPLVSWAAREALERVG